MPSREREMLLCNHLIDANNRARVRRRLGGLSAALAGLQLVLTTLPSRALNPNPCPAIAPFTGSRSSRTSLGALLARLNSVAFGSINSSGSRGRVPTLLPSSCRIAWWSASSHDSTSRTATRSRRSSGLPRAPSQSRRSWTGHASWSKSVMTKTVWNDAI
jgi:hypothetical protein